MCLMFIHLHFILHLYVLINIHFCLIFQQEFAEASDIALNQYNETHHLERTSYGVSKAMSAAVNKKRAMLSSSFTKQLAIADINLTSAFLEEVKHHWDSFSVPEMLQEKLHRIAVSNVDAEVKVGWLKLWNGNKFDKDALYFPKSPSLILHLMIGYQSLHIGHGWKKCYRRASKYSFISSPVACRCAYSLRVYPNLEICGFQFNILS
jgi:hypothetical protein